MNKDIFVPNRYLNNNVHTIINMKSKYFSLLLLIFFLTSLLYVGNIVSADDDEDDTKESDEKETSKDDDKEDETDKEEKDAYEREVEVEHEDDKVQIKSELKNGENKDKIEFELKQDDGVEFKLKYSTETASNETEMKFKVKFRSIVEYSENNSVVGYQDAEFVSMYKLKDQSFEPIAYTTGTNLHIFTLTTTDGVFTIIAKISGSISEDGNATLTPNSIKFDVILNNFPYTQSDSSLALETRLKTEFERKIDADTDEEEAGFGSDETQVGFGTTGFFSWANTADADGTTVEVVTSSIMDLDDDDEKEHDLEEGETTEKLWFSFIATNATKIFWDPKVGVESQGTLSLLEAINGGLPGFELYIALIAVFVGLAFNIRKRKVYN